MNAVWRLTLTYFSIVPLQKWLTIVGAVMFASTVLVPSPLVVFAAVLGAIFIVIAPLTVGGTAMRFGSSRSTLQLRPGGRWKMLVAAVLTVCLMTAICALAIWAVMRSGIAPPRGPNAAGARSISDVTLGMWGVFSLFWLASFAASASQLWAAAVTVGFMGMSSLRWEPLKVFGPVPITLAALAAAGWLAFAVWYLYTRQVRSPGWIRSTSPLGISESNSANWYASLVHAGKDSRTAATRAYLLGATSPVGLLMPGVIAGVVLVLLYFVASRNRDHIGPLPVVMVNVLAWIVAAIAAMVALRARFLWLREGRDRDGLFALGERTALYAGSLPLLSATVLMAGFSIAIRPDMATEILVYAGSQLVFAICLMYFGLSLTRGWSAWAIAGGFGIALLWIVQMVLMLPGNTLVPPVVAPIVVAASAVLALLLRRHARNRWRSADWHLVRPPPLIRPR